MQRVSLLNGKNKNYDFDLSALFDSCFTYGVITGFELQNDKLSPGKAFVEVDRLGQKFYVLFELREELDITLEVNEKLFIEINQEKINDGSSNNEDGTGIGEIKKAPVYPSKNYLKLYEKSETEVLDKREFINLKDKFGLTRMGNSFNSANQLLKLDENGALPSLDGKNLQNLTVDSVGFEDLVRLKESCKKGNLIKDDGNGGYSLADITNGNYKFDAILKEDGNAGDRVKAVFGGIIKDYPLIEIISQTDDGIRMPVGNNGSNRILAQSFYPDFNNLKKFIIKKKSDTGNFNSTVTIKITSGSPTGTALYTRTYQNADWKNIPNDREIEFYCNLTLSKFYRYYIVITTGAQDPSNHINIAVSNASSYPYSNLEKYNGSSYIESSNEDLYFRIFEGLKPGQTYYLGRRINTQKLILQDTRNYTSEQFGYDVKEVGQIFRPTSDCYFSSITHAFQKYGTNSYNCYIGCFLYEVTASSNSISSKTKIAQSSTKLAYSSLTNNYQDFKFTFPKMKLKANKQYLFLVATVNSSYNVTSVVNSSRHYPQMKIAYQYSSGFVGGNGFCYRNDNNYYVKNYTAYSKIDILKQTFDSRKGMLTSNIDTVREVPVGKAFGQNSFKFMGEYEYFKTVFLGQVNGSGDKFTIIAPNPSWTTAVISLQNTSGYAVSGDIVLVKGSKTSGNLYCRNSSTNQYISATIEGDNISIGGNKTGSAVAQAYFYKNI